MMISFMIILSKISYLVQVPIEAPDGIELSPDVSPDHVKIVEEV